MLFGFQIPDLLIFVVISLCICITVCALAMEAAVLFVPAFIFFFPRVINGFPQVSANEAIGLAITVEFFGYTSSVLGYWFRRQIDWRLGLRVLALTVPLAVAFRVAAFFVPGDGLIFIFGVVLLVLAWILFKAYRDEVRHTCLLCGDSIAAMRMGDGSDAAAVANSGLATGPAGFVPNPKKERPNLSHTIAFNWLDRLIMSVAGALAGVIGVAIGEITSTFLAIRKKVPVKVATGTSALVLHVTILSALCANLVVLFGDIPFINVQKVVIPWHIAFILAPVVVVGGQIGSMINSKLSDLMLLRFMMTAYTLVGMFVLYNVIRAL